VHLCVERRGEQSVVTRCSGVTPLAPRLLARSHDGFAAVALIQTAGGPLGGDAVAIEVDVGPGAALELRTIAATVVLPGHGPATQAARVRLGAGARLVWHAEPVIVTRGADYDATLDLELASGATAVVRESVLRGRHGEPGGDATLRLRCDLAGGPLLRDAVRIRAHAPETDSAAVLGGARAYGSVALLGLRAGTGDQDECALAGPGTVLRAVAADAAALSARLALAGAAYEAAVLAATDVTGSREIVISN
jgi:urease accessory protein